MTTEDLNVDFDVDPLKTEQKEAINILQADCASLSRRVDDCNQSFGDMIRRRDDVIGVLTSRVDALNNMANDAIERIGVMESALEPLEALAEQVVKMADSTAKISRIVEGLTAPAMRSDD